MMTHTWPALANLGLSTLSAIQDGRLRYRVTTGSQDAAQRFTGIASRAIARFRNLSLVATTTRKVSTANRNDWQGMCHLGHGNGNFAGTQRPRDSRPRGRR